MASCRDVQITPAPNPPRRPHVWTVCLLLSQMAVAAIAWRGGWAAGLTAFLLSHVPFWWATMKADSALFSPVLSRLPTTEPLVWLTIDDGPSDDTSGILDLLDRHGARATFFIVGQRPQQRPELVPELLRRGHGLGNHSHSHPQATFWSLGPLRMAQEIGQTQQALATISGQAPRWRF